MTTDHKPCIAIIGGGGHAKVVIDVIRSDGRYSPLCILDLNTSEDVLGVPVKLESEFTDSSVAAVLGLGEIGLRCKLAQKFESLEFPSLISRSATVSSHTVLGEGTVVMPGAIVNPGTEVGRHVIVNSGAVVEHDCHISDFVHVCPGACVTGGVQVGAWTMVGAGSVILPYRKVGQQCVIGAGCVVTRDVPDGATVVGNPGRVLYDTP